MDGQAFGNACYDDPVELASMACSSISGVTAQGVASCSDPSVSGNVLTYTLHVDGATSTSQLVSVQLQPCETYSYTDYWEPVLAAFFVALVTISAARMVYTKVFNRETF